MSAVPAAVDSIKPAPSAGQKLQPLQSYVRGRIFSRRKIATQEGTLWLTVLRTPARDAYSHPSTLEVRSRSSLGNKDDDWDGVVEISGFPRSFDSKPDKETGEVGRIHTAEVRLTVVE